MSESDETGTLFTPATSNPAADSAAPAPRKRVRKAAPPAATSNAAPDGAVPAKKVAKKAATEKATAEKAPAKKAAAKKTTAKKAPAKKLAKSARPAEPTAVSTTAEPPIASSPAGRDGDPGGAGHRPATPAVTFMAPPPVETLPSAAPAAASARAAEPQRTRRRRSGGTEGTSDTADADASTESAPSGQDASDQDSGRSDGAPQEESEDGTGEGRRRRRGRRGGRGRVRTDDGQPEGDQPDGARADRPADEQTDTTDRAGVATDGADAAGDGASDSDDGSDDEGGNRRRRRRRRRGGGAGGEDKAESEPDDGVRSVKGSTRLEAKRQRRRDGRDTGRRRAPILSESEFLARRESVARRMVVRQRDERTQIAVLEDGVLVEHYVTKASSTSYAGNVYLGRVQNVLPSMEAAFIDIGKGRNAVLYAGEVDWAAAGLQGGSRSIQNALKSGDSVLVQVTKDPIAHKGARLTSQISLPGRYLVYVPGGGTTGISRKLPDTERQRLKAILKRIVPDDAGVIIRTAAEGASDEELTHDVERLRAQWETIEARAAKEKGKAPVLLHGEPDLAIRVVRDVFNEDFADLTVEGEAAWSTISDYVDNVAPDLRDRLHHYTGESDLFTESRVQEQLAKALERKVFLPSGGSLVIDRTEAMTVIDVNTGKFIGSGGNLEETVTRNNLEAAEEIVRQLRLRDVGGILVIDFIDMVLESNRDLVLRRLTECLGRDRTRHQVAEVTSLGLVQLTRKRVGQGLLEAFSEPCEHCHGRGVIVHDEPVRDIDAPAEHESGGAESGNGRRNRRGKGKPAPAPEAAAETEPAHRGVPSILRPGLPIRSDEPAIGGTTDQPESTEAPAAEPTTEAPAAPSEQTAATPGATPPAVPAPEPTAVTEAGATAGPPRRRSRGRRRAASRPAGPPHPSEATEREPV